MPVSELIHYVNHSTMTPPFAENHEKIIVGMGCFWGAEKQFWSLAGVYTTAVGYTAGHTANPNYQEVCTGQTGHNEAVLIVYDPEKVSLRDLLIIFWQTHNPTQGMRQGNDRGTQYRSGIYYFDNEQQKLAEETKKEYGGRLSANGFSSITTEIVPATEFYYAEDYHQQYLAKNPSGYCGLGGTGISFR